MKNVIALAVATTALMVVSNVAVMFSPLSIQAAQAGTNDSERVVSAKLDYKSRTILRDLSVWLKGHYRSMIETGQGGIKLIVEVAKNRGSVEQNIIDTVLNGVESNAKDLHLGPSYEEMISLLVSQAKGEPLPAKPTNTQKLMIDNSNGKIEGMAKVASGILAGWQRELEEFIKSELEVQRK